MTRAIIAGFLLVSLALGWQGGATMAAKVQGLQKLDGYFPLYWDAKAGKLWLVVNKWDEDFLYYESLPAGMGSNDAGLDRGLLGQEKLVHFERSGPKVMLVQKNLDYRALSDDAAEKKAVEDSFARSVIWGFTAEAEEGGSVLVDATNFVVRDAMNVAGRLRQQNQGTFRMDAARSAIYMPRTKAFPKNTEMEATVTFAGENVGNFVSSVTPTPDSMTLRIHHSFLELPPPGYKPRAYDPRSGYNAVRYMDFATPVDQPIVKRYIVRHRLEKKDPTARVSEAVRPIIYYVDRGAPEPIKSALIEGGRWWNQAFEAIGYKDAFRVEVMPEDADPMDARYSLIQWVHRSTRGWSYGGSVADPRTGEIIKGHVTLGSLRIRQDFMIAEGMLAPYETRDISSKRMMDMSLARIRQLSTHEIGHTLGLVHNFAASIANRSSVMDYPHPLITMKADGSIDLTDSYAVGAGDWDKVTIEFGYQHFAPGVDEKAELKKVMDRAHQRGLFLIADFDSRAVGGAHPAGHLWDNGANATAELKRMMAVRKQTLAKFGEKVIPFDTPMSEIENKLVPIYLSHRYQAEAAVKALGGMDYRYALRGDGQKVAPFVPAAEQRAALAAMLETLEPEALTLPESLLKLMPPPALGYQRTRESFRGRTSVTFDALAPAEAAANLTMSLILNPDRASRMVQQRARDAQQPSLEEVLEALFEKTYRAPVKTGLIGETQFVTRIAYLYHVMALASEQRAAPRARAIAMDRLKLIESAAVTTVFEKSLIKKFEEDPKQLPLPRPIEAPPGMPIGDAEAPLW